MTLEDNGWSGLPRAATAGAETMFGAGDDASGWFTHENLASIQAGYAGGGGLIGPALPTLSPPDIYF